MIVIGVDPGLYGAIAITGNGPSSVLDMPLCHAGKTGRKRIDAEALSLIVQHDIQCSEGQEVIAYIEDVHATPQMGVSSAYSFGRSMGVIEGALAAIGVEVRYVRPQVWKGALGLTSDKRESLTKARKLYPQLGEQLARVKDDGRAEALLIAWYGAEEIEAKSP